jgi:hypothetical protein
MEVRFTPRLLYPLKIAPVSAGGPLSLSGHGGEETRAPAGNTTLVVQAEGSHFTDRAIPAHLLSI